jgi:hypothetical protein
MIHRNLGVDVTWDKGPSRKRQKSAHQPRQAEPTVVAPLTWDIELSSLSGKEKQVQRSRRRKAVRNQNQGYLRKASVGAATLKRYDNLWDQLCRWSQGKIFSGMDMNKMDKLLTQYLEFLYLEGEDLSKANYLTAAVIYHNPGSKGLQALPLTQQSMKGWRRLCPPRARMPLPYEAVALLCEEAVRIGNKELALCMLLMFHLYLRPAEPFRLRVQDIVAPVGKGRKTYRFYAVLLHPNEVGTPSKTLQYDEMLTLDLKGQRFLGPALIKHLKLDCRQKNQPAFSVTLSMVTDFMEHNWNKLQLTALGPPHVYRLRHGGASHDAALNLRDMTAIQARGRWQSVKSLKNYTKGGRLQQLVGCLPKEVRRRAELAVKNLDKLFL